MHLPGFSHRRYPADLGKWERRREYLRKQILWAAGGLRNIAALLAPSALLLHNTGGLFDTEWVEAAYRLSFPHQINPILVLEEEIQHDTGLLAFLGIED